MPHIHTKHAEHDHTVSAFIINVLTEKVLFHKHKKYGVWIAPGGHIELTENPWETLKHELIEETGYRVEDLLVKQFFNPLHGLEETVQPAPLIVRTHKVPNVEPEHYHTDGSYLFVTDKLPSQPPAPGESEELCWYSLNELQNIPDNMVNHDSRVIASYFLNSYHAWVTIAANVFEN